MRVYKCNFTKFAEEAEKLADAFRRSLVSENFAKAKADELAIKKTEELCRRTARNNTVKGIIATTACDTPAEVIATLITERYIARKEKREQDDYQKRSNNKNKNDNFKNNKTRTFCSFQIDTSSESSWGSSIVHVREKPWLINAFRVKLGRKCILYVLL